MRFTYSWIKEHLDTKASVSKISDALVQLGHEVESVIDRGEEISKFSVGKILKCQKHPNADKLKVCNVETVAGERQIVCGAHNAREGINVIFADIGSVIPSNSMVLEKVKIRGVESHGMLCSESELCIGEDSDGIAELADDAEVGRPINSYLGKDGIGINDPIFHLTITPNRGDCFGVRGLARDLSALGLGTLKSIEDVMQERGWKELNIDASIKCPKVVIENEDFCTRFSCLVVKGIKNVQSPQWLKDRLSVIQVRSINAAVDMTNFLLFDVNRPLHVFDIKSLAPGNITIGSAKDKEPFEALDEETYELQNHMNVIRDGSGGVVSLAGVMGGIKSGTYDDTEDVLIESAHFTPHMVARTGQELNLFSDSRARFERGVDFNFTGLDMAARMLVSLCGGRAGAIDEIKSEQSNLFIKLDQEEASSLAGFDISNEKIVSILNKLGFESSTDGFKVPSWRSDCSKKEDLIEEVLRVIGYDEIPNKSLDLNGLGLSHKNDYLKEWDICRNTLIQRGLWETTTYCYVPQKDAEDFGAQKPIKLNNPIHAQMDSLRPSIVPSLLQVLDKNKRMGYESFAYFERGTIYNQDKEENSIAGLRSGKVMEDNWMNSKDNLADVYDVKGDTYELLSAIFGKNWELVSYMFLHNLDSDDGSIKFVYAPSWYHPSRSKGIMYNGKLIACYGQLHPRISKEFSDDTCCAFEVFLERIEHDFSQEEQYYKPQQFQHLRRDFSFLFKKEIESGAVVKVIKDIVADAFVGISVFDFYKDKQIGDDNKSLGFRVTFHNKERSFTGEEIQDLCKRIEDNICSKFDAQVRA